MSVPFLQSLEYSRPRDIEFRYLVFFQNEKPIGWAYVQVIPINLAKSLEFESNESGMFANIYLQLKKWLARMAKNLAKCQTCTHQRFLPQQNKIRLTLAKALLFAV